MISPVEISVMAGVALLLFGAERLPKIARSAGEMRREFMRGQAESEAPAPVATVTDESRSHAEEKDQASHSV